MKNRELAVSDEGDIKISSGAVVRTQNLVITYFTPPDPYPWMAKAVCKGVDIEVFFKEPNSVDAPGKKYCDPCPVKDDCLIFALLKENPLATRYGYMGGAGPAERDKIYEALKGKTDGQQAKD